MLKLKDQKYYNKNKRKFNKLYNNKWKTIAGPSYIGLCSYIFQQFYKEWCSKNTNKPTVQDFANYYTSHSNPVKSNNVRREDSAYYGRSVNELIALAEHYEKLCGDNSIPFNCYFDDVVNHSIVETFNGQMRELSLINEYEKLGYTAEHTYGKMDKDLGVDFIIRKNGKIVDYVQCKPISTFAHTNNSSLISDRVNFFHKEEDKKFECEKLGYPYYPTKFVLYNSEHPNKWCTYNGKRGFLLEELIDDKGNNLIDAKDFSYS